MKKMRRKKINILYLSITSLFSFKSALNNNFEMSPNANNSETKRKQTNDHDHNYLYEIAYVLFLEFLQMIEKPIFNLTDEDCHRH